MISFASIGIRKLYVLKEDFVFVCSNSRCTQKVEAGEIVRVIGRNDQTFSPHCTTVIVELPDGSFQGMVASHMLEELPK